MNPAVVRDMYRRQLAANGETVTLKRLDASGSEMASADVLARLMGFERAELDSGIAQGVRHAIVLAEDVESSAFPVPFRSGGSDKVVVRGATLNVDVADDSTRRVGGVLIAYDLTLEG